MLQYKVFIVLKDLEDFMTLKFLKIKLTEDYILKSRVEILEKFVLSMNSWKAKHDIIKKSLKDEWVVTFSEIIQNLFHLFSIFFGIILFGWIFLSSSL